MSLGTNGARVVLGAGDGDGVCRDGGGARGKMTYDGGCPRPRLGFRSGSRRWTEPGKIFHFLIFDAMPRLFLFYNILKLIFNS